MNRHPILPRRGLAGWLAQRRNRHLVAAAGELGAEVLDDPLLAADDRREGLSQHQNAHRSLRVISLPTLRDPADPAIDWMNRRKPGRTSVYGPQGTPPFFDPAHPCRSRPAGSRGERRLRRRADPEERALPSRQDPEADVQGQPGPGAVLRAALPPRQGLPRRAPAPPWPPRYRTDPEPGRRTRSGAGPRSRVGPGDASQSRGDSSRPRSGRTAQRSPACRASQPAGRAP